MNSMLATLRVVGRSREAARPVFSPEAAWLIADILGGSERAMAVCGHAADARLPRIAFKTGTSAGHRDAWAIAYNPEYVVGIWLGNPDGTPAAGLVGIEAAAPVAYEVFRGLYPEGSSPWYDKPAGLSRRAVCAASGQPPGRHCPRKCEEDYIRGVSDPRPCAVHRSAGGKAGAAPPQTWPPHIAAFLRQSGLSTGAEAAASGLRITSPVDGAAYRLATGRPRAEQTLQCTAAGAAGQTLYWFVDGRPWAATCGEDSVFWPLAKGNHTIVCATSRGRTDKVAITVE
jgi:penicillin-binding protein 1C